MSKETLKLALEALESCTPEDTSTSHVIYAWYDEELVNKAIKSLEEALAKEPLILLKAGENLHAGDGGYSIGTREKYDAFVKVRNESLNLAQEQPKVRTGNCLLTGVCVSEGHKIQLKREPIKWIGLSVEDIDKAIENNQRLGGFRKVGFAYDLEQVLKEKNT